MTPRTIRLAAVVYSMVGPTLAGSLIVAALVARLDTLVPILVAAGLGFVIAVPASVVIARKIGGKRV
jgi:hypothetical protein